MLFCLSSDLSILLGAVADPREPGSVLKLYAASFALNIALFHVKVFKRSSGEAARQGRAIRAGLPILSRDTSHVEPFPSLFMFHPSEQGSAEFPYHREEAEVEERSRRNSWEEWDFPKNVMIYL